jgi:diguanylate cyclase (GGDEF)-like protein
VRKVVGQMGTAEVNIPKILIVGDAEKVFLDPDILVDLTCQVCSGVSEAIDAAGKSNFTAIAVVMSGLSCELDSLLEAFRRTNPAARIILLARMYEEPLAIGLVSSQAGGIVAADDYLICPLDAADFYRAVTSPEKVQTEIAVTPVEVGISTAARIRYLEKLATEDDLTSLKNRRYIWEFARQIIERASGRGEEVTLLLFDVDNLKSYNDVYGHLAGDEILKEVAVLMRRCCRAHDVVGRIGGDEFAVVFWDRPKAAVSDSEAERRTTSGRHPREAISVANRFRGELKKTRLRVLGSDGRGVLTISGALASFPGDGANIEELFKQADKALLEAKRSGKNKIYIVGEPENDISDVQ